MPPTNDIWYALATVSFALAIVMIFLVTQFVLPGILDWIIRILGIVFFLVAVLFYRRGKYSEK
jgi:hypothetical protein